MRENKQAIYIIPLMSEFEILSSTKNAERMSELETEMILNIFDKLISMTAIFLLLFKSVFFFLYYIVSVYIVII
jgi:hypothetical protein